MPREWLIQHRAGTLAEWAAAEASGPVLLAGERAYITDLNLDVVGDGVTKVASLGAVGSGTYVLLSTQKQVNRVGGSRVGFMGSSITNGSTSGTASEYSYLAMVTKILGSSRVQNAYGLGQSVEAGNSGENSTQILARIPAVLATVDVLMLGPDFATNDASQAVPSATVQANYQAAKALADAAGKPLVCCTILPRSSTYSAENVLVRQYNRWLTWWCRLRGVPLADSYTAVCDTATGYLASAYDTANSDGTGGAGDGTHPNRAGHLAIATAITPTLAPVCPQFSPWPVTAAGDGLIADPLQTTNFSVIAGPFVSPGFAAITRSDWPGMLSVSGRRVTVDNSAGGSSTTCTVGRAISSGFSVGDKLLVITETRCPDGGPPSKLQLMNQSNASLSVLFQSGPTVDPGPHALVYTVGAGVTQVKVAHVISVGANATTRLDWGGLQVYNLTADGTAGLFGF